eukprot:1191889-Prorocentrum_minimum.AAC.2
MGLFDEAAFETSFQEAAGLAYVYGSGLEAPARMTKSALVEELRRLGVHLPKSAYEEGWEGAREG